MNPMQKRPQLHFTPPSGWMNDPNGLFYHNGVFHLYYQYDPDNIVPVSLHWGHATSRNLVHWEHQAVALYPDEHGLIYSGNLIEDTADSLGVSEDGGAPLIACFTYHKETEKGYVQSQGLAYSVDGGYIYRKYGPNPILTFTQKDFRDPMVFWNEDSQQWVMLVVAGRAVRFYGSKTLTDWEFLSAFQPTDAPVHPSEIWECPCMVDLTTENGAKYSVLFVSVFTETGQRYGMQYYIGNFDGKRFLPDTANTDSLPLDAGLDFYAGIIYGGDTGRTIMQGWMNCWYYARQTPAKQYRGSMSFPRELSLCNTGAGLRVTQRFARELQDAMGIAVTYKDISVIPLPQDAMLLELELTLEDNTLAFVTGTCSLSLTVDAVSRTIIVDRSQCGGDELGSQFSKPILIRIPCEIAASPIKLELLIDSNSIEVLCEQGLVSCSITCYPDTPFEKLELQKAAPHAIIKCPQKADDPIGNTKEG